MLNRDYLTVKKTLIICLTVSTEYRRDRQTDERMDSFNSIVRGVGPSTRMLSRNNDRRNSGTEPSLLIRIWGVTCDQTPHLVFAYPCFLFTMQLLGSCRKQIDEIGERCGEISITVETTPQL